MMNLGKPTHQELIGGNGVSAKPTKYFTDMNIGINRTSLKSCNESSAKQTVTSS